ncbi:hypothetical protein K2173_013703 [Erythroxylum novogranatense]|uniref:UDENN domain-containing protein n=1 Tax=Erythroxylum novogranatense TaxID=1862640 RepID=A0AAV8SA42_9ROSI|nr:hypothetical protein K2173_013703 [Erythroxylum novogranatense]
METKEDADPLEDGASSPCSVPQQMCEERLRMDEEKLHAEETLREDGEILHNLSSGNQSFQSTTPNPHRRSQSEILTTGYSHSNSFHKLKNQVQKAWRWGANSRDQGNRSNFNPEILTNQKRQWYQLHAKDSDHTKYKEPTSLFEHFVIVGLHPFTNLETVEDAFVRRKKWEWEMSKAEMMIFRSTQSRGPSFPTLEPQILFKYPPGKRLAMRMKDLATFCFPGGVKTQLLERSPSLSELNELIYGQEHLGRDDLAFVFSLKVADNDTLYGVCLHVTEIVQRAPGLSGASTPLAHSFGRSRFLVSAPRCYCILTKVPFFELHYEMLNSMIAQERLNRITQFVNELSLTSCIPSLKLYNKSNGNADPDKENDIDWMAFAIPIDSAVALSAAAAGIIKDEDNSTLSPREWEPRSPESTTTESEASDFSQVREADKDVRRSSLYFDDCASESSESRSDTFERMYGNCENDHTSPENGIFSCSRNRRLERIGSFDTLFSPARSMTPEDEDDEFFSYDKDFDDDSILDWARENKNDLLQIVCGYHALSIPKRGSEMVFHPLEHLQAIVYRRPQVSDLGFDEKYLQSLEATEVSAKLAVAEEALALSIWTTATVCRVLSLESVLALIAGTLLEKQVAVVYPNLGVLSAIVLSVLPMIRPFQWQSLFLPILPTTMLDFLDAPVPYIVGIQHKPADLKLRTFNLVHINVQKDQVKSSHLPTLPRYKELVRELGPVHARLQFESPVAKRHPVYRCSETQAEAASKFLMIMRRYMESLCSELRSHTITSVQSNDRVSLLLKDSFVDSFPSRDRPFIKLLVDTQLFTVLSDSRLSRFEHERV